MTREAGSKDPLHGVTLEKILKDLVEYYGWEQLAVWIRIDCFANQPSISSSLRFLRRTPWARKKVENLYRERPRGPLSQNLEIPVIEIPKVEPVRQPVEEKPPAPVKPPSLFTEVPIVLRAQIKMFPQMDKPAVQEALMNKMAVYFETLNHAGSSVMVAQIISVINSVDGVEKIETMNFFRQDEGVRSPHPRDLKMGRVEVPVVGRVSFLLR